MAYPKWMYRKHPELGMFQQTLVASAEAGADLGASWAEDPSIHGFAVRPAAQISPAHGATNVLYEVVTDSTGKPVEATIEVTIQGDIPNGL